MQLQKASRKRAKIKIGLQGASGFGKSMSALLLAYGLCGNWQKVAVVDSENHSISLYAHVGDFSVVDIAAPYSPEKYIEAIRLCEQAGIEVIILDSISHEWEGSGGMLDIHGNMTGNSFTNWSKLTPRHNAFINAILQSPAHVIATIRTKQDYVLVEKNGKQVPEKVGLKGIMRQDTDYDLTIVFDLNIRHHATASKDRTGLFTGKPEFLITAATGKAILNWCNEGSETPVPSNKNIPPVQHPLQDQIAACQSVEQLLTLYKAQTPQLQQQHSNAFTKKRLELLAQLPNQSNHISNHINTLTNGTITS